MITATWASKKSSPMYSEMREQLKKKSNPGEPTISRKEANRTWRENILGILSDEQRKQKKKQNQERFKKNNTEDY